MMTGDSQQNFLNFFGVKEMGALPKRLGIIALLQVLAWPAMAADYDLVINNGHVMDPETTDDEIASVGRLLYLLSMRGGTLQAGYLLSEIKEQVFDP
jgi:hypothetical protein